MVVFWWTGVARGVVWRCSGYSALINFGAKVVFGVVWLCTLLARGCCRYWLF